MKFLIVFVALFALAVAAPAADKDVVVLKQTSEVGVDSFATEFELSDGTKQNARGLLTNVGTDKQALSVGGSFSYIGENGETYHVDYVANENGFQPTGSHLPVA